MKILTWNVAGRKGKMQSQANRVLILNPGIVCLQEVRKSTLDFWIEILSSNGFRVADSIRQASDQSVLKGRRAYGVLIASRYDFGMCQPHGLDVPWPERALSVVVDTPSRCVEVHSVHLPAGSSDRAKKTFTKIETFEGIAKRFANKSDTNRILCGDFNSPWEEFADGTKLCFGGRLDKNGVIQPRKSERCIRQYWAEKSVMVDLVESGMRDAFRAVHSYSKDDYSFVQRRKGQEWHRRFDHVFSSASMGIKAAWYDHVALKQELSDHAALVVEFED